MQSTIPLPAGLLLPVGGLTELALESVNVVLLTGEFAPECLTIREVHFREAILGITASLEALDDVAIYRLHQLTAVPRPAKLWELVDLIIKSDNERTPHQERWTPSSN